MFTFFNSSSGHLIPSKFKTAWFYWITITLFHQSESLNTSSSGSLTKELYHMLKISKISLLDPGWKFTVMAKHACSTGNISVKYRITWKMTAKILRAGFWFLWIFNSQNGSSFFFFFVQIVHPGLMTIEQSSRHYI